jgi:hypothetical protein
MRLITPHLAPVLLEVRAQKDGISARGEIYNPENGRTYKALLTLRDADTLEIEGCILFVCRKQVWRRPIVLCLAMRTGNRLLRSAVGRVTPRLPRMQPGRQERVRFHFQGSIILSAALIKKLLKTP